MEAPPSPRRVVSQHRHTPITNPCMRLSRVDVHQMRFVTSGVRRGVMQVAYHLANRITPPVTFLRRPL